jgi:hypothetical protein
VLLVTFQGGGLAQYDAFGAHFLGGGVASAGVTFGFFAPFDSFGAEVVDVIFQNGTLDQFDAFGAHTLGMVF